MVVLSERKENVTVVAMTPLKAAALMVTPGVNGQHRGGHMWQPGGMLLVLWLANSASDAAPRFEGSAAVVMAQTPGTLDD